MSGLLARLWRLAAPTGSDERAAAEKRTHEQERLARVETDRHRWHRERNHFSDRLAIAMRGESRWK